MSQQVVVVGAGVVGLCAADALLQRGFGVTILDREREPEKGCSYGNGGIVVPSHFVPLAAPGMVATGLRMMADRKSPFGIERLANLEVAGWIARFMRASTRAHVQRSAPVLRDLNLASRAAYEEMADSIDVGYARRGLLMLCRTEKGFEGEAHLAEDALRLGLRAHVLRGEELSRIEPRMRLEVVGGVHFEDDAHLTPSAFMKALRNRVRSAGGDVRDGVEARGFRIDRGRIQSVQTDEGEVAADEVVLASGAWTSRLASRLGLRMPMLAGKGYGFTVANPPESPTLPAILVEGRIAVTPMLDGTRFVGTMELGPPNSTPNPARVEGMRASIPLYYPAYRQFPLEKVPVWCGLRPCTPDGLPYLGRAAKYGNLIVAAGHAMMGMSLGPISGRLVAQLVAHEDPSIPLELLSPDRYA